MLSSLTVLSWAGLLTSVLFQFCELLVAILLAALAALGTWEWGILLGEVSLILGFPVKGVVAVLASDGDH